MLQCYFNSTSIFYGLYARQAFLVRLDRLNGFNYFYILTKDHIQSLQKLVTKASP